MNLKDYLAISGEHGLFKFIAQGRNAVIVEHLETKKRRSAHGSAKVSSLEDISIFTMSEDMPLGEVFDKIYEKESGGQAIDSKSPDDKLKSYFSELLPEYDKSRVYISDIKKVILWYNTLQKHNLLIKAEPEKSEVSEKNPEPKSESQKGKKARSASKPKAESDSKAETKISKPKNGSGTKTKTKVSPAKNKSRPKSK